MGFPAIYPRAAALVSALLACAAPALPAQVAVRAGGGATFPVGEFDHGAGTGWLAVADMSGSIGGSRHVAVGLEVLYGRNPGLGAGNEGVVDESHTHLGAFWIARYRLAPPHKPSPYVQLGVGLVFSTYAYECDPTIPGNLCGETSYSDTEPLPGLEGAIGVDVPLGRVALWAEGRYVTVSTDDFRSPRYVAVLAGIRAPL